MLPALMKVAAGLRSPPDANHCVFHDALRAEACQFVAASSVLCRWLGLAASAAAAWPVGAQIQNRHDRHAGTALAGSHATRGGVHVEAVPDAAVARVVRGHDGFDHYVPDCGVTAHACVLALVLVAEVLVAEVSQQPLLA